MKIVQTGGNGVNNLTDKQKTRQSQGDRRIGVE